MPEVKIRIPNPTSGHQERQVKLITPHDAQWQNIGKTQNMAHAQRHRYIDANSIPETTMCSFTADVVQI
jgi:hypothetical protein